jgi:hypothetical protein
MGTALQSLEEAYRRSGAGAAPRSGGPAAGKPSRRSGPSADTLDARADRERLSAIREEAADQQALASLNDDILAARAALATAAEDILQFELQQIASDKSRKLAQYQTEVKLGELTQTEYDQRAALVEEEARLRGQALLLRKAEADVARAAQDSSDLADERARAEQDALQLQYDLAQTEADRRSIAHQILDAEDAYLRSKLEAVIASQAATDAEKERARIALASLEATAGARRGVADAAHEGALDRYLRGTNDPKAKAEEAAVREMERLRDGLAEGLAEQIGIKNDFVKSLFSIFLDQVIFRPLAESLRGASGAGGGIGNIVGSLIGSIFGRATGGPVRAGRPYIVGEGGREMFVPQQNGVVVPNHRLQAQSAVPVVNQSFNVDARGAWLADDFGRMLLNEAGRRAMAMDAKAAQMTLKAVPSRMQSFQRNGT